MWQGIQDQIGFSLNPAGTRESGPERALMPRVHGNHLTIPPLCASPSRVAFRVRDARLPFRLLVETSVDSGVTCFPFPNLHILPCAHKWSEPECVLSSHRNPLGPSSDSVRGAFPPIWGFIFTNFDSVGPALSIAKTHPSPFLPHTPPQVIMNQS